MIEINFPAGIDTVFSATAPVAPARGKRWCDTNSGIVYTWTGTEWAELEGMPTFMVMLWPRSLDASLPAGWMACDGTNGTPNQSDTGSLMYLMRNAGTVATPTASPGAGSYGTTQSVTLACATAGVTIKYTTNGTTPSRSNGSTYSTPVSIAADATLKVMAYKDGMVDSAVLSAAYTIATAPTVTAASVNAAGTQLTVTTSAAVTAGAGGNAGWAVTASGGAVTASYASGSGTTSLVLTLSREILAGETLTLAYTQPGNGWENSGGIDLATFSGQAVTNGATPKLLSATILANGTTLREQWSANIAHGAGGNGGAALTGLSGGATTLSSPTITGAQRDLTISRTVLASETGGSYAYTQPGNGIEGATGGVDAATFSGASVTNSSTQSGGFSPPVNTVAWFKADELTGLSDNDPVGTWLDDSGEGNDVTASGSARPLYKTNIQNSLPVVRFDGSDDVLKIASDPTLGSQPFTVHMVALNRNSTADLFPSVGGLFWACQRWGNDGKASSTAGTAISGTAGDIPVNAAHQLTYVFDGASSKIFVDGVEKASGDAGAQALQYLMLGCRHNGGSLSFAQVDLGEVLVRLGGRDTATEDYLQAKWATP